MAVRDKEEKKDTSEKKKGESKAKYRFRLKPGVGPHYEANPNFDDEGPESEDNPRSVAYEPGDIVESNRPLDKIFVNKFKRLAGPASQYASHGGEDDDEDDVEAEWPVTSVEDARVKRADRHLTEEQLKNKKHLIPKLKSKKGKVTDEELQKKFGEEVTSDFEGAEDADLRVFKKGNTYHVSDADDPSNPISPKQGLKKDDAKKFLQKYTENEGDSSNDEE